MTTKPEEIARVFKVGDRVIGWDESALCSWHAKPGVVEWPGVSGERVVVRMDHGVTLTFHVSNLRVDFDRPADPAREEQPEPAAKAPDPYHAHNERTVGRLISDARFTAGKSVDQLVSESMLKEDAEPDEWAKAAGKDGRSARDRLVAALRAEQAWRERPDMLATFPKPGRNPR